MTPLEAAQRSMAAGISTLPPKQNGTKAPDSSNWKRWQEERAKETQIECWYRSGRTGVGWVTGKISGNLEVIDFDDRSTAQQYRNAAEEAGLLPLLERVEAGYAENTPNGLHLPYRCSQIGGSTKLAKRDKKTLIETKGEGGFIIVAPTFGGVNPSGVYELRSGSIETIETITPEERKSLHDLARIFDESIVIEDTERHELIANGRPGDDYNERADWDILQSHGWSRVFSRQGVQYWRRPGKRFGISATTNHNDSNLLYVFSSSTEFEPNRGYSKFSAYSLLEHNGDFGLAASALFLLGYGQELPEEPGVDLSYIMQQDKKTEAATIPSDLSALLKCPGILGELTEWINKGSYRKQPVLALGAAIAAMSVALGRKVRTIDDLRPNIYIVGVGESSCGKEYARTAIKRIFSEIGKDKMIGESFASDTAVESILIDHPESLFLIDEIGHFMGTVNDRNTPGYAKNIPAMFLKLYSASNSFYKRRAYGDREKNEDGQSTINQPSLSIYGTSVPSNWYGSLTKEYLTNGLVGRILVFDSHDPIPELKRPTDADREPPKRILEWFKKWTGADINPDAEGNLETLIPKPQIIPETSSAQVVFSNMSNDIDAKRRKMIERGEQSAPYGRLVATARKLALVRAAGVGNMEITEEDAKWGVELSFRQTDLFIKRILETASESKYEDNANKIREFIKDAGKSGRTKSQVSNKFMRLGKTERAEALFSLEEAGRITRREEKQKRGAPKTTYLFIQ